MKRRLIHVGFVCGVLFFASMVTFIITNKSGWPYAKYIMGLGLVIGIVGLILFITGAFKGQKWEWEQYHSFATSAKLMSVEGRKPVVTDLCPDISKHIPYDFSLVDCGEHGQMNGILYSDDPTLPALLDVISNKDLLKDKHITKTKIMAVNNDAVTYTSGGISVGGALIGGILAGDVGALLGGLTGSKTSQTRNGENIFTFLVVYDDRPPETEKVKESSQRFKFFITKLET